MLSLMSELGRQAAELVKSKFPGSDVPEELTVTRATKAEFGDFQCNAALQLAKPLGQKPRDVAAVIAEALGRHDAVAKTEIAGPGFVNIYLKDTWVATHAGEALTLRQMGAGQKV